MAEEMTAEEYFDEDGNRPDGRKPDEMRETEMEANILKNAEGSARVRMGDTVAIAAVFGPKKLHPKHLQESDRAVIKCRYSMMPFSVDDRIRPGTSRRGIEISKVTRESVESAVKLEEFPRAGIELYVEIVQADAGTRCCGINAASLALADAGLPMEDLVTGIAAGEVQETPVLDLTKAGEEATTCDVPIAYMPRKEELTLLQTDGDIPIDRYKEVLDLAVEGAEDLYQMQKDALKEVYEEEKILEDEEGE